MRRIKRTLSRFPNKPPTPDVNNSAASAGPVMPCTAFTIGAM
jgi:hypothetical protein